MPESKPDSPAIGIATLMLFFGVIMIFVSFWVRYFLTPGLFLIFCCILLILVITYWRHASFPLSH